jgi:hypothetical protein
MPHLILKSTRNEIWTYSLIELTENEIEFVIGQTKLDDLKIEKFGIFNKYTFSIKRDKLVDKTISYYLKTKTSIRSFKIVVPKIASNSLNILYASCNQYYKKNVWDQILAQHNSSPYHLAIFGGDQVYEQNNLYPDGPFALEPFDFWLDLHLVPIETRYSEEFTKEMKDSIDEFYFNTYVDKFFNSPEYMDVLPNIPIINMWDDHEIFDGYGSYPNEIHNSPVVQGIFLSAKKHFCMFQMHSNEYLLYETDDKRFVEKNLTTFYELDNILLINVDTRSNRNINQMLNEKTYMDIFDKIKTTSATKIFLNISCPVISYNSRKIEKILTNDRYDTNKPSSLKNLPIFKKYYNMFGIPDFNDDIFDQWSHQNHKLERDYFVTKLFEILDTKPLEIFIFCGDIHVGGIGTIKYKNHIIQQYVSSSIGSFNVALKIILERYRSKANNIDFGNYNNSSKDKITYEFVSSSLVLGHNWLKIEVFDELTLRHYMIDDYDLDFNNHNYPTNQNNQNNSIDSCTIM